jgi:hypothetical protein
VVIGDICAKRVRGICQSFEIGLGSSLTHASVAGLFGSVMLDYSPPSRKASNLDQSAILNSGGLAGL